MIIKKAMLTQALRLYALVILLTSMATVSASDAPVYKYWNGWTTDDKANYYIDLARMALDASAEQFGPYQLEIDSADLPTRRARQAIQQGVLHFQASTLSPHELENSHLLAVPYDLELGLLGYRNLIVRKERLADFVKIQSKGDLRRFSVGMGMGWPDVTILRDNGFEVHEANNYSSLFPMLNAQRFDFLLLGIDEIDSSLIVANEGDDRFSVVPEVLVTYPMPLYFLVCSCQPQLAERLAVGLKILSSSGQWYELFSQYKAEPLADLRKNWRLVIKLDNTQLPKFYKAPPDLLQSSMTLDASGSATATDASQSDSQ